MSKHEIIEVIARGVCVKGGRLLVCHSKGARNTYLPGGHVEFTEPAAESLRREIEEEMGLEACVGRFLGGVEHSFIQKGRRHCEVNLVFAMDIPELDGQRRPSSREEYIEFTWVSLRGLTAAHLEPAALCRALPKWLKGDTKNAAWASTY